MTKKDNTEERTGKTSAGGHLGGTRFGQQPDAKTVSTPKESGDKARPNAPKP